MSIYGKFIEEFNDGTELIDESLVSDIKQNIADTNELREQWRKVADKFVKHKWIYRYIDDKQKERISRHYDVLKNPECSYNEYKRSFRAICQFMGLPYKIIILENIQFEKDKKDKEQEVVAVKYSKGLAKVNIPQNVHLIHVSPVENLTELTPTFRSKVQGKYMYPSKRCFFTVAKEIKPTKAGLEKQKLLRYTTKANISTAYIDPTYADFKDGSVYVETESPIPVISFEKKLFNIFKRKESTATPENNQEDK
jgi:hypothetical protein